MVNQFEQRAHGDPVASPDPDQPARVGAFVVVMIVLVVANLTVRFIDDPKWQLRLYMAAIMFLLFVSWLRWAAVQALLLLAVVGGAMYFARYRDDVDRGQMSRRGAVQQVVRHLTGIRFGPPDAWSRYAKYLGKIDSRSPAINQRASELVRGCQPLDRLCETAKILAFVTDRVDYRSDPRGAEYIKGPEETMSAMAGDCEDKSILLISLLESIGHSTFMVFTPNHAYALDCYDRNLADLLADGIKGLGNAGLLGYLRDLAPRHDPRALMGALEGAVGLKIDKQYCYPLESTQAGSWIGVNNGEHEYVIAFDPVTKKRVQFLH